MNKLTADEIEPMPAYAEHRPAAREAAIAHRARRRVQLGDRALAQLRGPRDRALPDPGDVPRRAPHRAASGGGRARRLQRPHPRSGRGLGDADDRDHRPQRHPQRDGPVPRSRPARRRSPYASAPAPSRRTGRPATARRTASPRCSMSSSGSRPPPRPRSPPRPRHSSSSLIPAYAAMARVDDTLRAELLRDLAG